MIARAETCEFLQMAKSRICFPFVHGCFGSGLCRRGNRGCTQSGMPEYTVNHFPDRGGCHFGHSIRYFRNPTGLRVYRREALPGNRVDTRNEDSGCCSYHVGYNGRYRSDRRYGHTGRYTRRACTVRSRSCQTPGSIQMPTQKRAHSP